MKLLATEKFQKQLFALPVRIQTLAIKQQALFVSDPFHPSLHTEKLRPFTKEVWSIRIDKRYRMVFRYVDQHTILLLAVGPHDWIYKLVDRM
jgi:toxin HigB-1